MPLAEWRARLAGLARDEDLALLARDPRDGAGLKAAGAAARDAALADALARYSADRPRAAHIDLAAAAPDADGVARAPLPRDREAGCAPRGVEYPAGRLPASWLPRRAWMVETGARGAVLATRGAPRGAELRLHCACPHHVDAARDTVPEADREAVLAWAAALLFERLAAATAGDSHAAIGAEAVERAAPSERWRRLAADGRARYRRLLGLDGRPPAPAHADARLRRAAGAAR